MTTMEKFNKRQLSQSFLDMFKPTGKYHVITECVKEDPYLDFEMRGNSVMIYYRGGRVLCIRDNGEIIGLDPQYIYNKKMSVPQPDINCINEYFFKAKSIVDKYECHEKMHLGEKEIQQRVVYENNLSVNAQDTDYFIADTEWQNSDLGGRADIVAFRWFRSGRARKQVVQLTLIEVKQGDNAIKDACGLAEHFSDFMKLKGNLELTKELGKDMLKVLTQKKELGLVKGLNKYFEDGKSPRIYEEVDFVFLLANYHHYSTNLNQEIQKLPADSKFFVSSFMGYGLYHHFIKTKGELMNSFPFVFKDKA